MAKGGAYENTIARYIAKRLKKYGIKEEDIYRTRNSGATKTQPGDIQLSPKAQEVFPFVIECKHYRAIRYVMCKPMELQCVHLRKWWKQMQREQKQAPNRCALLIMRQNFCPDVVAFLPATLFKITKVVFKPHLQNVITIPTKQGIMHIIPLKDFFDIITNSDILRV